MTNTSYKSCILRLERKRYVTLFCCNVVVTLCALCLKPCSHVTPTCHAYLCPPPPPTIFSIDKRSQNCGGRKGPGMTSIWHVILSPQWDWINSFPLLTYYRDSKHQMKHMILILTDIFIMRLFHKDSFGAVLFRLCLMTNQCIVKSSSRLQLAFKNCNDKTE